MNGILLKVKPSGLIVCEHGAEVGRHCSACARMEAETLHWWTSSSGRIEFQMTREQAESVSGPGPADDNVAALVPELAAVLAKIEPATLAAELKEYGAWDAAELSDHRANLARLVWLAGCDIRERGFID